MCIQAVISQKNVKENVQHKFALLQDEPSISCTTQFKHQSAFERYISLFFTAREKVPLMVDNFVLLVLQITYDILIQNENQ